MTASLKPVALMSIRPRFAAAILDGSKRVEFRKRPLAANIARVLIYTTLPVGSVEGEYSVIGQVVGTPDELWRRFAAVAGMDSSEFFDYFAGSAKAVGIVIGDVERYEQSRPLEDVDPGSRPPQSFKYLPASTVDHVPRSGRRTPGLL